MNCLSYALSFWYYNRNSYSTIYYNSDHCINMENGLLVNHNLKKLNFLPIEDFGYDHIYNSFEKLLKKKDIKILKEYFDEKNRI